MFSSSNGGGDDDHLYDFNTNIDSGGIPGTSSGVAYGAKPLMTAYRAPGTSAQRPLMSSMGRGGGAPMSRAGVPGTGRLMTGSQGGGGGGEARPMTSVSGAGYHGSTKDSGNRAFDPLNIGKGPAPPLAEKSENSHEDKAKEMEKGVHRLIEASAELIEAKDMQRGLDKAKEAGKAERLLCKFREGKGLAEQINSDLTYAICFNLANAYFHNKMYEEALNTYQLIVKNKQYPQSGRLRVNMGNIYYEQKKFPQAIKMYRMALDQIPSTGKELRFRIFRNIGNAFVKLGQFQDAVDSYDSIMVGSADIQTAFNLLLCLYVRGDKEKMKRHFLKMLSIPILGMTDDDEEKVDEGGDGGNERKDSLKEELALRHEQASDSILLAARLIAPVVEDKGDWVAGYKWVMEQLRPDYEAVANKLEIDLSMAFMKKRRFEDAIEVLKAFERKDTQMKAMAATNLSFIYFLEGDYQQAEKQADIAIRSDRYNAKALVNKGNCLFVAGDYGRAKEMFLEAVGVEADCVEGLYNLGLVNLKLNSEQEAHNAFDKLHTILPSVQEALFQLGTIYERRGATDPAQLEQAAKTFEMLLNKVPGDPNLCSRLGQVYEKMEDENTACHWQTEAHRHYPVNLNVISWLGVWYVKREMYEQAIEYFDRAAVVQPGEVKWQLMVTSCYRRLGDLYKALELYQKIHEEHPENIESLQYLEALCKDLGRPYEEYTRKLDKLRRALPANSQQGGAMTRAGNGPATQQAGPSAPQRTERPKPAKTGDKALSNALDDGPTSETKAPMGMAAPRAGGNNNARPTNNMKPKKNDDEDDFGDTDVSDLLG